MLQKGGKVRQGMRAKPAGAPPCLLSFLISRLLRSKYPDVQNAEDPPRQASATKNRTWTAYSAQLTTLSVRADSRAASPCHLSRILALFGSAARANGRGIFGVCFRTVRSPYDHGRMTMIEGIFLSEENGSRSLQSPLSVSHGRSSVQASIRAHHSTRQAGGKARSCRRGKRRYLGLPQRQGNFCWRC